MFLCILYKYQISEYQDTCKCILFAWIDYILMKIRYVHIKLYYKYVLFKYICVCMHFICVVSKYRRCYKMADVYSCILCRKDFK